MQHKRVDCAMTTEPTVSKVLADNTGLNPEDMRTAHGAKKSLGGTYPAPSLSYAERPRHAHKDTVQKLVNA